MRALLILLILFSLISSVAGFAQDAEAERKHSVLMNDLKEAGQFMGTSNFKEAQAKYEAILVQNPGLLEAQVGKTNALFSQNKGNDALAFAKQVSQGKTDTLESLVLSGLGKFYQKDFKGAEVDFKAAVALNPSQAYLAHYYLGYLQYAQRKNDDALPFLLESVKTNRNFFDVYYLLGDIYLAKNETTKTLEYWKEYLQRAPNKGPRYDRVSKYVSQAKGR